MKTKPDKSQLAKAKLATQHLAWVAGRLIELSLRDNVPALRKKRQIEELVARAYLAGSQAGSKKRWRVMIAIGSKPKLEVAVYIQAIEVVKTSHDLVEADGISVELPGKIDSVREVSG